MCVIVSLPGQIIAGSLCGASLWQRRGSTEQLHLKCADGLSILGFEGGLTDSVLIVQLSKGWHFCQGQDGRLGRT